MSKFNIVLDSQQINEYMICPLKFHYKYRENIRLVDDEQRIAADKGTLIHHLADLYYTQRALNPSLNKLEQANCVIEAFKLNKVTASLFPNGYEVAKKLVTTKELEDFLCKRFMLYVTRYLGDDFNVVIGKNKAIGVEVGFSNILYEDETKRFILEGRIDLLNLLGNNSQCWVDHKTEGKYNPLYKYKTQFRTYAVATGFNYGMVNYIGLQEDKKNELLKGNKLFRRELIYFPDQMITEWREKMIKHVYYPIWAILTQRFTSVLAERDFYEIRNESSCSGAFDAHPCQFTPLCEEYNWEMKANLKEFKYVKKEPWTPWK